MARSAFRALRLLRRCASVSMLSLIDQAPTYAEGRGVRIPVRNATDARNVLTLASIKFAH